MRGRDKVVAAKPTGRQRSRLKREQQRQRIAVVAGVVAVLIILAIPLYGFIATFVLPPRKVIARVNDTTFTTGYLVKLLRMQQKASAASGQQLDLGSQPFNLVNILTENELIRQAAPRYNLSVANSDIDKEIRNRIIGEPKEGDTTSPEELKSTFRERYRQYLNLIQISEARHRQIVAWDLYREKLREILGQEVPTVLPQIHLYSMTVPDQQKLDEVKRKLGQGFTFQQLAKDFSTGVNALEGGDQGWKPQGVIDPQLEDKIWKLNPGELSEPFARGEAGFDLYYVGEKADARPVDDTNREFLKNAALQKWIGEERANNRVDLVFDSDTYAWIIKQLKISQPPQTPSKG